MSIDRSRFNKPEQANSSQRREPVAINDIAGPGTARKDATTAGTIHTTDARTMNTSPEKVSVDVGIDVVGACGHKIGEVVDVRDDCIVVEKGFFVPEDIYVPKSAISGADEHHLTLNVTKESVRRSDWDEDPDSVAYEIPHKRVS